MPDVLTHPSHIGYHHQWSPLLLLLVITAACVCCVLCGWGRSIADKVCRVIVLLEDFCMVVNICRLSCMLIISLALSWRHLTIHVSRIMGLKVEIPVCVHGLPVHINVSSYASIC